MPISYIDIICNGELAEKKLSDKLRSLTGNQFRNSCFDSAE